MKKSLLKIFVVLFSCATLAFGVTACKSKDNDTPHTHQYNATVWDYNETYHWHNSTCSCNVKVDFEKHTIDDSGCCTVCEAPILPTDGVYYDVSADGTYAEVIDYVGTATKVKIADTYGGLPVTSIYSNAFKNAKIVSVIIPDNMTSIGDSAFYKCSSLTSVTIPDSVTSIGNSAFSYCNDLTSITIPDNVTEIGYNAFYNCSSLTSVTIPDSVTSIVGWAFMGCSSLTSVTIPDNVTSIGEEAFSGCSSLTSVTIPDNVTSIGEEAFSGCSSLTSVTIPDNVTEIGESAFYNCNGLKEVIWNAENCVVRERVHNFYGSIFQACDNLTKVTIGENVETIPSSEFSHLTNLQYNTFGHLNYLGNEKNLYMVVVSPVSKNFREYEISHTAKIILDYTFKDCTRLTNITIPDSVTSISSYAFMGCSGLTSITIGNSVTSIGNNAFSGCSGLTSITIGNSVTSIGDYAFSGCSSLTSITIPDSVTSIGEAAFDDCSVLEEITIPFVGAKAGKTSKDTRQYPFGYIFGRSSYTGGTATKQYYYWDPTTSTTYDTYYIPSSLKKVTVTGGNILYGAFYNCSSLTSITIPDNVTSIGERTFSCCSSLTSITIGNSVTSIGDYAFSGCSSLTNVYYSGTAEEWEKIRIDSANSYLTSATRYYYIENETDVPTDGGNYWHYVNGIPTIWS